MPIKNDDRSDEMSGIQPTVKKKAGRPRENKKDEILKTTFVLYSGEEDRKERFLAIQEKTDLNTITGVLRRCIDETHDRVVLGLDTLEIETEVEKEMRAILNSSFLKYEYHVSDRNSLINTALKEWLKSKRAEINLFAREFRHSLTDDEKSAALAFYEHQMKPEHPDGLTIEDLAGYSGIDKRKILQIVKTFTKHGLVYMDIIKGTEYYYARLP
ncbi:MAG: hypothetical protein ACFFD4_37895 [Candidatus Odinarchaeota archaeon]